MSEDKGTIAPLGDDDVLDDIEDLPGFANFPTGAYSVTLADGLARKKIGDHDAIEMAMTLDEIMELNADALDNHEPGEVEKPPIVGDICTTAFMLDNKFGVQKLKDAMVEVKKAIGSSKISDLCSMTKGMKLLIIVKRTYDKEKDRFYSNLKKVSVL